MTREQVYQTEEWKVLRDRFYRAETAEEHAEICRLEAELVERACPICNGSRRVWMDGARVKAGYGIGNDEVDCPDCAESEKSEETHDRTL